MFAPRTIIVSLLAGILITLVAGSLPGDARDPGAAHRGRPGRRDAPALALAPLLPVDLGA